MVFIINGEKIEIPIATNKERNNTETILKRTSGKINPDPNSTFELLIKDNQKTTQRIMNTL